MDAKWIIPLVRYWLLGDSEDFALNSMAYSGLAPCHRNPRKASNYKTIPLCPYHRRQGPFGEAVHNGTKTFEAKYGTQLEMLNIVNALL
jgi:hypothetical protein